MVSWLTWRTPWKANELFGHSPIMANKRGRADPIAVNLSVIVAHIEYRATVA